MPANQGARLFWERAIREFAHEAKGPDAVDGATIVSTAADV